MNSINTPEASTVRAHVSHPDGLLLQDAQGNERGYVDPKTSGGRPVLEDLWVMQGSLCDLKCKHCYTASSPVSDHLQQITSAELRPYLEEARTFGVQKIYFTGGEVFVDNDVLRGRTVRNEEFLQNLAGALEIAPVEILTNGRRHIRASFDVLSALRARHGDRLRLRITLESIDPAAHDAIRGRGTFAQTVETIEQLSSLGFVPVITAERPLLTQQSDEEIANAYHALFQARGVAVEVNLIENLLEMGHQLIQLQQAGRQPRPETFVSTNCFSILGKPPESLMCHYSRCVQKVSGSVRVYPCPVIYDDARYELGRTLRESFRRVHIAHKNCYDYCLKGRGGTCRTHVL